MRFSRYGRYEFIDTQRKRMAFARKQKQERESYPLFAEEIAAGQIDVETEMALRKANWSARELNDRAQRALEWRRARAKLAKYPQPDRDHLRAYWQRCGWPGDPAYLLTMLHKYANNHLNLRPPTIHETEANRQAVRALTKQIEERVAANRSAGKPY